MAQTAASFGYETYLSPFTWRYASDVMRELWSEQHKRRLWRRIWLALAEAQHSLGLVTAEQAADVRAHVDELDIERAHQIEGEIRHDLMAELRAFAEQCPLGGPILHLGATSMDIEDNADALRLRAALDLVLDRLRALLHVLAGQMDRWADMPCMGFTHLQPAEPTTLGYRLAQYGQDLLIDFEELERVRSAMRGKGLKGAVGTSASYVQLLSSPAAAQELEARVMAALDLAAFPVASQTYPRKQDWLVLNALAGLAGSLYKFAFDLRLLQSPPLGEWAEPFEGRQVGSSAMPFKRNPVNAENLNSLARWVAALPHVAWENAAHSLLERTLDDSANRRLILPQAFLAADDMLLRATHLMRELQVDEEAVARTLSSYGTFAATERLLMELVKAGADRQSMHEIIRSHSIVAWAEVAAGRPNPLPDLLSVDPRLSSYLSTQQLRSILDASGYTGDAAERARRMAERIRQRVMREGRGEKK
ncbi:MAG: adenylosuccinate lyase [Desulfobacca sp. RBG_16_60_12]|nr:MAG: adenylosuccinate lyase [Desulfobacca sp. RBG_16_60_12]